MPSQRGPYKKQSLEILKARGVPIGTIIDVGVQHGTQELIKAFPDRKHLLFEPVSEFLPHISNAYAHVPHEIFTMAVSDENGSVALKTSKKISGMDISHSTMVFGAQQQDSEVRNVPVTTLDHVLLGKTLDKPYLLKIDIDGHEMKALRGAHQTLSICSVVIVECVHKTLPERIHYVLEEGFRLFDLAEPCYYDDVFWQCDAIFIKTEIFNQLFTDLGGGAIKQGMYKSFC